MADHPLSAALEEIRHDLGLASHVTALHIGHQGGRLLAALDAALKLADEWTEGSYSASSALDEDRVWVRAECGAKIREAITRELLGEEAPDVPAN